MPDGTRGALRKSAIAAISHPRTFHRHKEVRPRFSSKKTVMIEGIFLAISSSGTICQGRPLKPRMKGGWGDCRDYRLLRRSRLLDQGSPCNPGSQRLSQIEMGESRLRIFQNMAKIEEEKKVNNFVFARKKAPIYAQCIIFFGRGLSLFLSG